MTVFTYQSILLSLQVLLYLLFFEVINDQAKDKLHIKFLAVLLWKPSVNTCRFSLTQLSNTHCVTSPLIVS